jgi:hypothetical protein
MPTPAPPPPPPVSPHGSSQYGAKWKIAVLLIVGPFIASIGRFALYIRNIDTAWEFGATIGWFVGGFVSVVIGIAMLIHESSNPTRN